MKKKIKILAVMLAAIASLFVANAANLAFAADKCFTVGGETICTVEPDPGPGDTVDSLLPTIAGTIATVVGILSVIMIIWAGYTYMTAAGDPGKIMRAKQIILGAIIGVVITILAAAIATYVTDSLF